MSRRFGTDGIRDLAGRGALALKEVHALGRVLGRMARGKGVLIGRDTRASGPSIEEALSRGLSEAGAHVFLGGVIPTPAVARSARGAHAFGIVVGLLAGRIQRDQGLRAAGLKASRPWRCGSSGCWTRRVPSPPARRLILQTSA